LQFRLPSRWRRRVSTICFEQTLELSTPFSSITNDLLVPPAIIVEPVPFVLPDIADVLGSSRSSMRSYLIRGLSAATTDDQPDLAPSPKRRGDEPA
jgi:hypothetical protein